MRIKVCGMKDSENIKQLARLPIDYMGLIFYQKSQRFVGNLDAGLINALPRSIKKTGVFVNAEEEYIIQKVIMYNLDFVQLHGVEAPEFCRKINEQIPVVKAFSVSDAADLEKLQAYDGGCRYFLFDTKTPQYGGSGQKFDWGILHYYNGNTPFFLSGGISPDDSDTIKRIKHPAFYGIDMNSKFEIEPGFKNIQLLEKFIKDIRS